MTDLSCSPLAQRLRAERPRQAARKAWLAELLGEQQHLSARGSSTLCDVCCCSAMRSGLGTKGRFPQGRPELSIFCSLLCLWFLGPWCSGRKAAHFLWQIEGLHQVTSCSHDNHLSSVLACLLCLL